MAIKPGDSRLPRYFDGNVEPVYRKLSPSKGVGLYLLHRDFWGNAETQYRRRSLALTDSPPECTGVKLPSWEPGFKPHHNGIIEGIAHVNPWLLELGSFVYAEVEGRYRYFRSELDSFDFEIDQVVYTGRVLLNPPPCFRDANKCFSKPSLDIESYSAELRQLYEKLGGPAASRVLEHENLTQNGVVIGNSFNNRKEYTIVPQTMATRSSNIPEHPYVTYNLPFKFDINLGPDSITIKSNKPKSTNNDPVPRRRKELHNDAIYGFLNKDVDSDPEAPSTSEDDDDFLPRIRHPRQAIKKKHGVRTIDQRMQSYRDLFHPDSYPWHPRPKCAPKSGIYWTVKVYSTISPRKKPEIEHISSLNIRKLSYLPQIIYLHTRIPPTITTDYCLAIGPRSNSDSGVITLSAKLNKLVYGVGDPVMVYIKVHNTSNRVISKLVVEVKQCIRVSSWTNRVWRNTICKREVTAENADAQMPILPATQQLKINVRVNPWPVESQYEHLFYDKLHKRRLPRVPIEEEAYTLRMPLNPGIFFAVQQPSRHENVPLGFILRRAPAFSTLIGVLDYYLTTNPNDPISAEEPIPQDREIDIWAGDPYGNCRCFCRPRSERGTARCSRGPPDEPYQIPIKGINIYDEDEEKDRQISAKNDLSPTCNRCGGIKPSDIQPIYVSYEVVVSVLLLTQGLPDPLSQDYLLHKLNLGSGLLDQPNGLILGLDGPSVSVPLIFTQMHPQPEAPIPVANYNIDQRQDRKPKFPSKPNVWEPSLGKGLLVEKLPKSALCLANELIA